MKKTRLLLVQIVIGLFLITGSAMADDNARIGIVDFEKILQSSDAGKAAQAEINSQGKKMEEELEKKKTEIEDLKSNLEREAMVMSAEMRYEKEREIRIKRNDIKDLEKIYMMNFKSYENRMIKQIKVDVFQVVREIGDSGKYHLILEKGAVIYAPESEEITDKVIEKYNTKFAEKKDK